MSDTSPSRIATILWHRGLGDLGDEIQRRLQHADYLAETVMHLRQQVKELEKLLPDDVGNQRKLQQHEHAAAVRASYGGGHRAPAESDG